MTRRFIYIVVIVVLVAWLWYGGEHKAIARKSEVGERIADVVLTPARFFSTLFNAHDILNRLQALEYENEDLKAQLIDLRGKSVSITDEGVSYVRAKVYSTYPFNTDDVITINAGSEQGIVQGAAVTVGTNLFLGQVVEVRRGYSVVRTVFDDAFRLAVHIGDDEVEALLRGGRTPFLTLIDKDVSLSSEQSVITADREVPFGLLVGTLSRIRRTTADAFQEADIDVAFDVGDVKEVLIRLP